MSLIPDLSPSRSPKAVALACLAVAAVFAVVIALSVRGSETVETQGTLTPTTAVPGSAPPRTSGSIPPPEPTTTTEAPTTTTAPAPASSAPPATRPATTAPPSERPTPQVPEESPVPVDPPFVDPFRIAIDRIGVDAPVVPVGVEPGTNAMQIPGLDDVGWYQYGARPGDPAGTAVLVGHVDGNGRPGVFADLRDLVPGDTFTVTLPDGGPRTFAVTGLQQFDKQALPSDLFTKGGPPRLALITCGGPFDPATGHYVDNVVVVAAAI
jgi:hypothetical protein